jgi:hypothetical protein
MVTNERQRLYALESRAKGAQSKKAQGSKKSQKQDSPTPIEVGIQRPSCERRLNAPSPSPYPAIDPKLNQYHYNVDEALIARQSSIAPGQTNNMDSTHRQVSLGADVDGNIKYLVNIMQEGRRVKPKATLSPESCPDYFGLLQHIHRIVDDENLEIGSIKVLGPGGLMNVGNEDNWKDAIKFIEESIFMDGEVRCVVEAKSKL